MHISEILKGKKTHDGTISIDGKLIDAAKILDSGCEVIIVLSPVGVMQGVVTKTDIVRKVSSCEGAMCLSSVALAMTRNIVTCRTKDRLDDVSQLMKEHHLKNIPVIDEDNRLLGVLTAREILRAILGEVEFEEAQMINYVKGIGYR